MDKNKLFNDYLVTNLDLAYRFAFTFVKNEKDAEDIVSDSVLKALKSINRLKKPQHLKTWFYKIIANTAFTHLKKKSKLYFIENNKMDTLCESNDDYSHITIQSIVSLLDENHRVVIVLRFLEDMKIKEISEVLNINENTVKTRLYSALKLLKISLEDKHEGF
ncbi:MAG: sigma-70 family RNA polymerase sigma factor [Firmicutes bacterium]|nr:sigma-70 family RNA polymerase sigma factor [Bacillota bacterium]